MARRWTCDHCGTRNEDSAIQCSGCGLIRGSVVTAGSAGATPPPPSPATPPSHPGAQWSGDPQIADEASRWQEQRRAEHGRGAGGQLATVVLATLLLIWLALCGVVVALTVDIVNTPDAGEVMIILPPMYCVLSAAGTGFVIYIRRRILGRRPSAGRIVGSVFSGAIAALLVGTGLAFVLGILPGVLLGDDFSDPVVYAAWMLAAGITLFVLPVLAGIGGVLYYVSDWRLLGRLRGKAGQAGDRGANWA